MKGGRRTIKRETRLRLFQRVSRDSFLFSKEKKTPFLFPLKIARGRRDEGQTQTGGGIGGT